MIWVLVKAIYIKSHFSSCEMQVCTRKIESLDSHYALKNDLIEHLWRLKGQ